MGELADRYIEVTPTPVPAETADGEEELEMLEDDYFPEDL